MPHDWFLIACVYVCSVYVKSCLREYVFCMLMWYCMVFSLFCVAGSVINCPPPAECVEEGETYNVTCTRSLDLTIQSWIMPVSMDGTATCTRDV